MDAGEQRAQQNRRDPHGWNSVENFLELHEGRLASHPFIDTAQTHTLTYERRDDIFIPSGQVFCRHNVVVDVTKYYASRIAGGRRQIRGFSYRYNASIRNGHNVLRYDNGHIEAPEEFHRHAFHALTGRETERLILSRYNLPTFYDILTEIQNLVTAQAA